MKQYIRIIDNRTDHESLTRVFGPPLTQEEVNIMYGETHIGNNRTIILEKMQPEQARQALCPAPGCRARTLVG